MGQSIPEALDRRVDHCRNHVLIYSTLALMGWRRCAPFVFAGAQCAESQVNADQIDIGLFGTSCFAKRDGSVLCLFNRNSLSVQGLLKRFGSASGCRPIQSFFRRLRFESAAFQAKFLPRFKSHTRLLAQNADSSLQPCSLCVESVPVKLTSADGRFHSVEC